MWEERGAAAAASPRNGIARLIIPNAPQLCTGLWERRVLDGYDFIYSVACATGGQRRVAYRAARGMAVTNGEAVPAFAAVEAMVQLANVAWGRVGVLVNNAGLLRAKSFS